MMFFFCQQEGNHFWLCQKHLIARRKAQVKMPQPVSAALIVKEKTYADRACADCGQARHSDAKS